MLCEIMIDHGTSSYNVIYFKISEEFKLKTEPSLQFISHI